MSKLRKSAQGQACQIRIPGECRCDEESTVLCHMGGAGMGLKAHDMFGAFGCDACHMIVDGHVPTKWSKTQLRLWHLEGVIRTQKIWLDMGLIKTP